MAFKIGQNQNECYNFILLSGIKTTFDIRKPKGNRVIELKVKSDDNDGYEDVIDNKNYKVTTISFLAKGGDGSKFLQEEISEYIQGMSFFHKAI